MYLIFDTETTGLPKRWDAPLSDSDNWPRCVQIAWQFHDEDGNCISHKDYLIKPDDFDIPYDSEKIHGISTELAKKEGESIIKVLNNFKSILKKTKFICGHNVNFDINIIGAEFLRAGSENQFGKIPVIDTCTEQTAGLCKIPGGRGGKFKFPTLVELNNFLFNENFDEAHNATADVEATARCFFELLRNKSIIPKAFGDESLFYEKVKRNFKNKVKPIGLSHVNLRDASKLLVKNDFFDVKKTDSIDSENNLIDSPFIHFHVYSQFSVLHSTSQIPSLVSQANKFKMPAISITDKGNLMGAFHFIKAIKNHNENLEDKSKEIKPIIGCEFNVCEDSNDKSRRDDGFQTVFLAKNKRGYHNLSKMSSLAQTTGFYYVPRIDKEIVRMYKDDLIVLSGNLYGEISSKVLNVGERQAEESLVWWKNEFKDDFYIEIMRHQQENESRVNKTLLAFSKKHNISIVATNNTYYTNKEDANAHDILLCLKDGEKQSTPIGKGRGFRYGLPNQEYYFKSQEEMKDLFMDLPEAILNCSKVFDKITPFDLDNEVLLPKFEIPKDYDSKSEKGIEKENAYLKHLTFIGAKNRYEKISNEIEERLNFELEVIANTGYPGYFLIVQDFIAAAREMGVSVGPGRGSAAGSVVAYCLGITNLDPIKYNLLFERFLNPDRVSLPDIDIDFDDEGRSKVIDYVIEKYGSNQVAQIITYGKMAAKSSIRDTARVLDLPLADADRIAKLVPNIKLDEIFKGSDNYLKEKVRGGDEFIKVKELQSLSKGDDLAAETLRQAHILEGSLRNTGIHACGVIITPDDITQFVPIANAKDSDLVVTQFDNSVVEGAGLLKMDFLGLKTLTLIKDTVKLVKYKHNIDLKPDEFPLDDEKTYALFQRGDTVGIFQYESNGMKKYLRDLKPTVFADLIAMNALYRPGPLEYIPSFVARKNGTEQITFDLPEMEEDLKETYGITVYQEQVMLLSQKLGGFSKGEADLLRKAMGKKIFSLLDKLKPKFIEGGKQRGHSESILEKIWKDWEAFASYAFNKSHSTCYAWIGFQTAYLKAHYPAEYMAAVLSNNMNDIKQVSFFMEECKHMGLEVLGPDVNESFYKFTVNDDQAIRFGMGAIKGVGKAAVDTIIQNRNDGQYTSIFDMAKRIDLRAANKKTFENLALAGGFDSFSAHRGQYFNPDGDGIMFFEKAMKFGSKYQENINSLQINLFENENDIAYKEPEIPECDEWEKLELLKKEKEVVGIYISAHPLDDHLKALELFSSAPLSALNDLDPLINKDFYFTGIINDFEKLTSKNGNGWAKFILEDLEDQYEFRIFGEEFLRFSHFINYNQLVRFKVSIREGWKSRETGRIGPPRIKFLYFELLSDTIKNNSKKLIIKSDLRSVSKESINKVKSILNRYKGDKPVGFDVYYPEEEIKISLNSRKQKVDVCNELLDELDSISVKYSIK